MLVLPKVIPVNVQRTAETWPFWVKLTRTATPLSLICFNGGRGEWLCRCGLDLPKPGTDSTPKVGADRPGS